MDERTVRTELAVQNERCALFPRAEVHRSVPRSPEQQMLLTEFDMNSSAVLTYSDSLS
jgi:hypothetical protein